MGIGYERIPYRFPWRTSEDGDESADNVVYPSDNNDDPSTVPHERINDFLGCKQAEVLQQNSRLDLENGGGVDDLNNVEPLPNNQSTIRENDEREVVHRVLPYSYASVDSIGAHLLLRRDTVVHR